jgi:membrane-bound lytic murein transglycosylase D
MLKSTLSKTAFFCHFLWLASIFQTSNVSAQALLPNAQYVSYTHQQNIESIDSPNMALSMLDSASNRSSVTKELKAPKISLNRKASEFMDHYLKKNEEALTKIRQRSKPYFKIIESLLTKHDLPIQLKYLAVVESELRSNALSRVGARGPWQLMPATARCLGLKVTSKLDERTNYYKSTAAVCKYLRDLYKEYDDWLLVIAAYNSGPGTVNKAIKKAGSSNFWKLQYFLPAETRGHVKRYISTHYFFENEGGETTLTKAETVAFTKAMAIYKEKLAHLGENADSDLGQNEFAATRL